MDQKDQNSSLDELIASVKADIGDRPGKQVRQEPLPGSETAGSEQPVQNDQDQGAPGFNPDFGHTFDDYGDYEETQTVQPAVRRKRRWHIKKLHIPTLLIVVIYIAVAIGLGLLAAKYAWKYADDVLALTRPDEDVEIIINENYELDEIAETLKEAGSIEYEWLFKLYCKVTGSEHYFDPGVYTINKTYDYHAIVNGLMASAGTRETVTLMIIEGADSFDIYDLLEKNGVCTREKLEQAAAEYKYDYDFLRALPYGSANRLEGYLFPDTYQFYLMDEPENVLGRLIRNFNAKIDEDDLEVIKQSGYTLREIITLASIVEAEAGRDEERAKIASVMFNRLKNWEYPLLGMDSTVYYGAKLLGVGFSTDLDSPYNTYKYPGIPKGPICNPGLNSIRAVMFPEETNYYYFATGVDGMNHFFETEEAFLAFLNSDEYQDIIPDDYQTNEP